MKSLQIGSFRITLTWNYTGKTDTRNTIESFRVIVCNTGVTILFEIQSANFTSFLKVTGIPVQIFRTPTNYLNWLTKWNLEANAALLEFKMIKNIKNLKFQSSN